ncbi:hypothetical protein [Asaia sp. HN010]|uniref:hypothetical protein n=1 Tax=Asaia sp. HN010 TaxID=3081233 RepID=UPI0030193C35
MAAFSPYALSLAGIGVDRKSVHGQPGYGTSPLSVDRRGNGNLDKTTSQPVYISSHYRYHRAGNNLSPDWNKGRSALFLRGGTHRRA